MKDRLLGALVCSVFVTLVYTGCQSHKWYWEKQHDAYVELAYQASSNEKSPLSTLKPMTFQLLVDGPWGPEIFVRLGEKLVRQGEIGPCVYSATDPTEVIKEALKNELENNGHTVVGTTSPTNVAADVTIHVTVKEYRIEARRYLATLVAEIELVDSQQALMLSPKLIEGTYHEIYFLRDEAYKNLLNGALAEFIANFSRDPSVLAALKSAESKQ